MDKIINCTPHQITINGIIFPAAPKGEEVRVATRRPHFRNLYPNGWGNEPFIMVFLPIYEELVNFTPPGEDEYLVVSAMAKAEILRRHPEMEGRVFSPGLLVRDENGVVIGADGLDM
jgi:hypothetical protein